MNSFLNKYFSDTMDFNRRVQPIEENGRDFVCRVYIREPKQAKMKERREKDDGSGETELVVVYRNLDTPYNFVGVAKLPRSLFFVKTERDYDQLNRTGYRMV